MQFCSVLSDIDFIMSEPSSEIFQCIKPTESMGF